MMFDCLGAVVKEDWAFKYKNPVSFLRIMVEPLVMQQQSLWVPLQTTDWANSHISRRITRKISGFASCVGEAHILSGGQVFQSHVYSQDDTFSPL